VSLNIFFNYFVVKDYHKCQYASTGDRVDLIVRDNGASGNCLAQSGRSIIT